MSPPNNDITILSGPLTTADLPQTELFFARRALHLLKSRLGPAKLEELLAPDIASAHEFWTSLLPSPDDDDDADPSSYTSRTVTLHAPGITPAQFLAWFKSKLGDREVMWAAHPEHYINGHEVLETVGKHVTRVDLKFLDAPARCVGRARDAEKYPVAMNAAAVLPGRGGREGRVLGYACHQFGDDGEGGMEACFGFWLPGGVPGEVADLQGKHLAVEWRNWIGMAREEVKKGANEYV